MKHNTTTRTRGFLTIFVLIASAVFLVLLSDFMASLSTERTAETIGINKESGLHFAEAGLEYYRWHFAQFPGDLQDDTGGSGPYQHTVTDPVTETDVGVFSLEVSGTTHCNALTSARVRSTGWPLKTPTHTTKVTALYGKPTVASLATPAVATPSAIASGFASLKSYAEVQGVYLAPSGSGKYGYKIVLKSNGTFDASPVTGVTRIWGYSTENGWVEEDSIIASTGAVVNYSIPSSCPVVFIEDTAWIEGIVANKVTFAVANIITAGVSPNAFLTGDITYAHMNDDGFTLIAENSILISLQSPDIMTIKGIYVPGAGRFGRNRYDASGTHAVPSDLSSYITRSTLTDVGTLVSNGALTTKWMVSGTFVSGYSSRTDTRDSLLNKVPPPFTPATASDLRFTDWRIED